MKRELVDLVWSRAGGRCEYCQMSPDFDRLAFQIDHILAVQHSGQSTEDNLALACYACNHHKGPNIAGFDVITGQTVPLFNPRRDAWNVHFRWDGPELFGLTPVGRATVYVLAISLDYRVALRRSLIQERVFPPSDKPVRE